MKREFTLHLIERFGSYVEELAPRFVRVKSASKGGGATYRVVNPNGTQVLLGFETVPQRERVALFLAWSRRRALPNLARAESQKAIRGFIDNPAAIVKSSDEGILDATDLGQATNVLDLEPSEVPWQTVILRAGLDPAFAREVTSLVGHSLEALPSVDAPSISWEQYFSFQDQGITGGPTVPDVLFPLAQAMRAQLSSVLLPFAETAVVLLRE